MVRGGRHRCCGALLTVRVRRVHRRCSWGGGSTIKPQVMAACPPFAYPTLERALGKDFELVPVNNLADAQALLERNRDWAMVICGVYFDESRMYELLDYART